MPEDQKKTNVLNQRPESNNWLISFSTNEKIYILNKQQFSDDVYLGATKSFPHERRGVSIFFYFCHFNFKL